MSFHIAIMSVAIEASRLTCLMLPRVREVFLPCPAVMGERKSRVISVVLGERRASNHVGVVEVRVK